MAFLVTTTGTLSPVVVNDLAGRSFVHPLVDFDLETVNTTQEIAASADLQSAIDNGYITVTDEGGNSISNVSQVSDSRAIQETFTKAANGLSVGDVVRHEGPNPEDWTAAQADTGDNSEAMGVVSGTSGDDFTVTYSGRITGLSGLTAESIHFLDASTAGALTTTSPAISKPIIFATSTTAGIVLNLRGLEGSTTAMAYRIPHTWALSGEIAVPSGQDDFIVPFFISLASDQTASLVKARYQINGGTSVTCSLQNNGGNISGYTNLTVTTTPTTTDATDVPLSEDDALALVVTAVSGSPENLTFTIFIEVSR